MTSLSTQEVVLASVFVCLLHPALTPSWQPPLSMLDLGASFTMIAIGNKTGPLSRAPDQQDGRFSILLASEKLHRFFGVEKDLLPDPAANLPIRRRISAPLAPLAAPSKEAVSTALRQRYGPGFAFRSEVQISCGTDVARGGSEKSSW